MGDSHQRMLAQHLTFLVASSVQQRAQQEEERRRRKSKSKGGEEPGAGGAVPAMPDFAQVDAHSDVSVLMPQRSSKEAGMPVVVPVGQKWKGQGLRVNFYWVDGVYENERYKCS